jgi:hypothetical protein
MHWAWHGREVFKGHLIAVFQVRPFGDSDQKVLHGKRSLETQENGDTGRTSMFGPCHFR